MTRWVLILMLALLGCPSQNQAVVSAPRIDEGESLVEAEHVAIDCRGEPGEELDCTADATYQLDAPGGRVEMTVHGKRAGASIDAGKKGEDTAGSPASGEDAVLEKTTPLAGVTVEHAPSVVRVQSSLHPAIPDSWDLGMAAPRARHHAMSRWLGFHECRFDERGCLYYVDYATARRDHRTDDHDVDLSVQVPEGWRVRTEVQDPPRGVRSSMSGEVLQSELSTGQVLYAPGGPFAALGALLALEPHFKWRVGYEMFAPHWIAHAIALEGDAHDERITIVPTSELASPLFLILPSAGVGLGLPIQVSPSLEAGARFQLSAHWPYAGLVATIDVFPSRASRWVVPSLYLQLAL